ncbi:MAG: hypothetical protein ISS78_11420 [Phycisphaerae bacterium]|nr:hypothetical protein [Phycisphaerae bacterium]
MNKSLVLLAVTVVLACVAPSAQAGEAARLCKFDQFVRVAKVTPEQRKVMDRIVADLDRRLETWDIATRPKRRNLESELDKARKNREMAKITTILNARRALAAERAQLVEPTMDQLVAQLGADQRGQWAGHVLFTEMHLRFKRFRLDAGQVAEIRSMCTEAGKTVAELLTNGKGAELAKVKSGLEREIAQNVLSGSQRESYAGTSGRQRGTTGERETEAERAERIRIAVEGFVSGRLAADAAKSKKAMEDAIKTAHDQLLPGRRSRPDTKNNRDRNNRNRNNRNRNNRNQNNRNRNNRNRNNRNRR